MFSLFNSNFGLFDIWRWPFIGFFPLFVFFFDKFKVNLPSPTYFEFWIVDFLIFVSDPFLDFLHFFHGFPMLQNFFRLMLLLKISSLCLILLRTIRGAIKKKCPKLWKKSIRGVSGKIKIVYISNVDYLWLRGGV